MTSFDRAGNPQRQIIVDDRKLDYLFDRNIQPDDHNSSRAQQNARQLKRLGFDDDSDSRQIVKQHLQQTARSNNNTIQQVTHQFSNRETGEIGEVNTEVRDSLFAG